MSKNAMTISQQEFCFFHKSMSTSQFGSSTASERTRILRNHGRPATHLLSSLTLICVAARATFSPLAGVFSFHTNVTNCMHLPPKELALKDAVQLSNRGLIS